MCWYSASNEGRSTTCGSRATPTFVVVLDNVFFPCGPVEAMSPGRQGCVDDERPGYNGRVDETQMRWLANLLAEVPAGSARRDRASHPARVVCGQRVAHPSDGQSAGDSPAARGAAGRCRCQGTRTRPRIWRRVKVSAGGRRRSGADRCRQAHRRRRGLGRVVSGRRGHQRHAVRLAAAGCAERISRPRPGRYELPRNVLRCQLGRDRQMWISLSTQDSGGGTRRWSRGKAASVISAIACRR